jgi:hypothetical protein
MAIEFKSLGRTTPPQDQDDEERNMFLGDKQSEAAARGSSMSASNERPADIAAAPIVETSENLSQILKEHGQQVTSLLDAEARFGAGERVFVFHDMDGEPKEIVNISELAGYTPEQILTLSLTYGAVAELLESVVDQAAKTQAALPPVDAKTIASENALSSLMKLAKGKISAAEVSLPKVSPPTKTSFQPLAASSLAEQEDELFGVVSSGLGKERKGAAGASPFTPNQAGGAPTAGMDTLSPTAVTVGEIVGRGVANVVATPFLAMSSAVRHLTQRFGSKPGLSPIPPMPTSAAGSLTASRGMPLPIANTLESITQWKRDRIEKAGREVEAAAAALMGTEDFVVWEDGLRQAAAARNMSTHDVVRRMHEDEDFKDLKSGMDDLWKRHPAKVAAFRGASVDFENNLRNVIKEYVNSDRATQDRVSTAMKSVEEKTANLPGFGEAQGEYLRTLAERVREIAKIIAEFVQNIVSKISGKAPATSELSV